MTSLQPSGKQRERLWEAVREAFSRARLRELLDFRLDKRIDDIAFADDYKELVYKIIEAARQEDWLGRFIIEVQRARPNNPKIFSLMQSFGLASTDLKRSGLEVLIRKQNGFLDIAQWRSTLGQIEGRVCKIEMATSQGPGSGTGFLVGPDIVMTNYHVVEPVIRREKGVHEPDKPTAKAQHVQVRFDYKKLPDGAVLSEGVKYKLADDWLIDGSPYSAADGSEQLPQADELDYALLRLDGSPADDYLGGGAQADLDAPRRGFIKLPSEKSDFAAGQALFIVQHPDGAPLKLALDTDSVIGVNGNGTRVRYKTNTLGGSSGSPCFDVNWRLVALHHLGDPNYKALVRLGEYNQGVPIWVIRDLLESRGHLAALTPADEED